VKSDATIQIHLSGRYYHDKFGIATNHHRIKHLADSLKLDEGIVV
jgi:hypothetical protein